MMPERMRRRQRLVAEHVEHGAGEMAFIEQGEQVRIDDEPASRDIDQVRAARKQREALAIEEILGVAGQRQQAHDESRPGEKRGELGGSREAYYAGEIFARPAPHANRESQSDEGRG